jgi:hypothetical protein
MTPGTAIGSTLNKATENATMNLNGKSRNGGSTSELQGADKFSSTNSLGNVPKSTTNKTYQSLTQKENE